MWWFVGAEFPTPWVAGGASVVFFVALVTALIRLNNLSNRQIEMLRETQGSEIERQAGELELCREAGRQCERRLNILIWTLQKNGLPVPDEIWEHRLER